MKTKIVICLLVLMNWSLFATAADVFFIKDPTVIYFSPTKAEINDILGYDEDYMEVLKDFFFNQSRLVDYFTKHNIKTINLTDSTIRIKYVGDRTFKYDRAAEPSRIGYILADGKTSPKMLFGLYYSIDLLREIHAYFGIAGQNEDDLAY